MRIIYQSHFLFIGFICAQASYADHHFSANLDNLDAQQQQHQQQAEKEREIQRRADKPIHLAKPTTEKWTLPQVEQPCFPITQIEINDYINATSSHKAHHPSQFQWAYQQAKDSLALTLPHCFGTQGLNSLMRQMQNNIIEKGYITTRVVITEQDLNDGKLVLTVIPGRLRHVLLEDQSAVKKLTPLTAWTALVPQQGDILNLRDIEQSLENLKRLPTADAKLELLPVQENDALPGESDLWVQYAQRFPFRLALGLDDAGSTATGRLQGSATLSLDNLFTANDLFYAGFTHTMKRPSWLGSDEKGPRRSQNVHFSYSVPFRYWQLSASHNVNQYHQQVAAAYGAKVRYSGRSETSKISLSRVLFRHMQHKTQLAFSLWGRQSSNAINKAEIDIQRKRTAGWEVVLTHRFNWNHSTLAFNANFKRGTGAYHAKRHPEERFNEGSSRMKILTTEIELTHPFQWATQSFHFNSLWRAQWNRTPLVMQDRFSIGGRYTVRGTDGELTLSGERGWVWRNELAWHIAQSGQQLYLTLDKGVVRGRATDELLGRSMVGSGIGLRGGWKAFSYDVFAGKALHVPQGFQHKSKVLGFNLNLAF
jgi:shlB family hemolysin secretion/activation protein